MNFRTSFFLFAIGILRKALTESTVKKARPTSISAMAKQQRFVNPYKFLGKADSMYIYTIPREHTRRLVSLVGINVLQLLMQTHLYFWGLPRAVIHKIVSDYYAKVVHVTDAIWKDVVLTPGSRVLMSKEFEAVDEQSRKLYFVINLPSGITKTYIVFDYRVVVYGASVTARAIEQIM